MFHQVLIYLFWLSLLSTLGAIATVLFVDKYPVAEHWIRIWLRGSMVLFGLSFLLCPAVLPKDKRPLRWLGAFFYLLGLATAFIGFFGLLYLLLSTFIFHGFSQSVEMPEFTFYAVLLALGTILTILFERGETIVVKSDINLL